jgi:Rrf2 family protein
LLSQKAKYALQALLALAELDEGDSLMIGDIAEKQRLPKRFLEQILLDLKHQGVVQSWRGKNGGYALLKSADKITFGEIVRIIDGPLAPLPCLSRMAYRKCDDCLDEERCAVRRVFASVHDATTEILDSMTLTRALNGGEVRELLRGTG